MGLAGRPEHRPCRRVIPAPIGRILTEFIAILASGGGVIGPQAAYTAHAATLLTFIVSSYVIMMRYPTPIAVTDALRRD